jgi:hypothetical protein
MTVMHVIDTIVLRLNPNHYKAPRWYDYDVVRAAAKGYFG